MEARIKAQAQGEPEPLLASLTPRGTKMLTTPRSGAAIVPDPNTAQLWEAGSSREKKERRIFLPRYKAPSETKTLGYGYQFKSRETW